MRDRMFMVISKIKTEYKKIPSSYKTAIIIGVVVAAATYITVLGNRIPNHDDINHLYSTRFNPGHGRWFQGVPATWSGVLSTPLSAFLGIVYALMASVFVNSILKIKTTLSAALTTCLMVTFPNLFCLMFYLNDVDTDMFAWLLVCVGAWLSVNKRKKLLPIVCYTLSLGIYQAYLAFAVGIICIAVLCDFLDNEKPVKNILLDIFRHAVQMLISLALYYVITKIVLRIVGTGLISGQGINMAGKNYTLPRVLEMLRDSFVEPIKYYFREEFPGWLIILFIVTMIVTVLLIIGRMWAFRHNVLRLVLTSCVLIALPAACGCIYFFGAEDVHELMIAGYSCILLIVIAIFEKAMYKKIPHMTMGSTPKEKLLRIGSGIATLCVAVYIAQHVIAANEGYVFQSMSYEQSKCYYNRLVTRIEETEGFTGDEIIYLVGKAEPYDFKHSTLIGIIKKDYKLQYCSGMDWFLAGRNIPVFMKNEMGINYTIYQILDDEDEDEIDIPDHEILNRYEEMGIYPQNDSIIAEDGAILVRLQ